MLRIWRRDETNSGLIDFGSVTRRSFILSNLRSVQRRFFIFDDFVSVRRLSTILTILGRWRDYLIPWRDSRDDAFLIFFKYYYYFLFLSSETTFYLSEFYRVRVNILFCKLLRLKRRSKPFWSTRGYAAVVHIGHFKQELKIFFPRII